MPHETVFVTLHIHTDGPIPGPHSLLTLSSAAHRGDGGLITTFTRNACKILRLQEISSATGISVATLRWYRHRGIGPRTFLLGRRVVAFESDVDAWITDQAHAHQGGGAA
jgi:predicted DNA-binding transcriptional regulator AlpA